MSHGINTAVKEFSYYQIAKESVSEIKHLQEIIKLLRTANKNLAAKVKSLEDELAGTRS